ncbi:MAG: hypothetical protein GY715_21225 [Planctomycetes bacterium]|nr:hypothetical protein [Planctomycetota bacterium]
MSSRAAYLSFCNVIHAFALILWIAALVSAAVAAMNVFPITDSMSFVLERYAAYPADEHGRIAAGRIMEGVFFTVDMLQFVAAPLALLTLLAQLTVFRGPWRRPAHLVRGACIVLAAALFAGHAMMLAPKMNADLRAFWEAAEAGDVDRAHEHRAAFNRRHPKADIILRVNLLLVAAAAVAGTVGLRAMPGAPRERELDPPRLLQGRSP